MNRVTIKILAVAAAIGGGLALSAAAPASAAPLTIGGSAVVDRAIAASDVINVRHDRRHARNYDRRYHGPRYRDRRAGYNHYRGGYWYRTPFWSFTIPFGGAIASAGSSHVAWCDNRYRSYDVRRDAFKGYDGEWHRCNSPYS
jgi:hypothetical protein